MMAKGHCLCGSVEIETKCDFQASAVCSCTSCQRCSGSAFSVNLVYPKDTVDITKGKGHVKIFTDKSESGNDVFRHFCTGCGNAIFTRVADGTFYVKAPVIEGALKTDPVMAIFTRNLPAWAEGIKSGSKVQGSPH